MRCIWCAEEHATAAVEHVVPEAVGCPEGLTLTEGEVCQACNSRLAHLDRVLADDFDFFRFSSGVPGKRRRPATIASRGNVIGRNKGGKSELLINATGRDVFDSDGTRIPRKKGSRRNIDPKIEIDGDRAQVKFQVTIGEDPRFVRAIHKIAFSTLAYYNVNEALDHGYDPIRRFVMDGVGARAIIASIEDGGYRVWVGKPLERSGGQYVVPMQIVCMGFLVDLTPEMRLLEEAIQNLRNEPSVQRWRIYPPGHPLAKLAGQ